MPLECHKIEKDNIYCPVYTCLGSRDSSELFLFFHPDSNLNSLRSYSFKNHSAHFVDFEFHGNKFSQIDSSFRCKDEKNEHAYGCQLSLSQTRSIQHNCKTEKIKKITGFDLKASEEYLTHKYISLALNLKDSAQEVLMSLGRNSPCNEKSKLEFNTSVIDQDFADRLMKEISSFDLNEKYPQNGCYQRATVIANYIASKYKIDPFKVFLKGDLTSQKLPNVNWGAHVATAIKVRDKKGNVQALVIDPIASTTKMLNVNDWLETVGVKANDLEQKISPIDFTIAPYWSEDGEVGPITMHANQQLNCISCEFEWDRFEAVFNGYYDADSIPK